MKKQDEGFTLIELLIVIVILGILATVVVFAVSGIRNQGDSSACEAEERTVLTAIEAYYAQNGNYPDDTASVSSYLRTELLYWEISGGPDVSDPVAAGDNLANGAGTCAF